VVQIARLGTSDIRVRKGNGPRLPKDKGLADRSESDTCMISEEVSKE
jgi:hypothetical protein